MKRNLVVVVLAMAVSGSLFAFDMGVGMGFSLKQYTTGLDSLMLSSRIRDGIHPPNPGGSPEYWWGEERMPGLSLMQIVKPRFTDTWSDMGVYAFLDVRYAELELGLDTSMSGYRITEHILRSDFYFISTYLNVGLMLKYPFELGSFTLYPMGGVNYRWNVAVKDIKGTDRKASESDLYGSYWNQLYLKGGFGIDYTFSNQMYFKLGATIGTQLASTYWKDEQSKIQGEEGSGYGDDAGLIGYNVTYSSIGFEVKLALGYKFSLGGRKAPVVEELPPPPVEEVPAPDPYYNDYYYDYSK